MEKFEWYDNILMDFEVINEEFSESEIIPRTKEQHRNRVKEAVRKAAFKQLMEIKNTNSKVKHTYQV